MNYDGRECKPFIIEATIRPADRSCHDRDAMIRQLAERRVRSNTIVLTPSLYKRVLPILNNINF